MRRRWPATVVVQSANNDGVRPGNCSPVRRSASALGTATRSVGDWFGWCNFCGLDLKDLKLVVPSISTSRLRWQKTGSSELKIRWYKFQLVENANWGFASWVTKHINMILARLTSVGIKFDDEVQALLLLLSLPDSWPRNGYNSYQFSGIRWIHFWEDSWSHSWRGCPKKEFWGII